MATYSILQTSTVLSPQDVLTLGLTTPTGPGGGTPGPTDPGTGTGGTGGTGGNTGGGTDTPTPPDTTLAAALADALASFATERAARVAALATARMSPSIRGPLDLAAAQLVYLDRAIDETTRAAAIATILAAG